MLGSVAAKRTWALADGMVYCLPVRGLLVVVLVVPLVVACGDAVIVQPGEGGADPSGTSTGSTTTDTATTSTTTAPPSMKLCGVGQPPCPPDEYCEIAGEVCDAQGTCLARPQACDDDCPGVCGCDGEDYCNECVAKGNGTDISAGPCDGDAVEYAAVAWPGGLDHIIIMKANDTDNTCWRIYVDGPALGTYDIDAPAPWGVGQIVVSTDATNCLDWQQPLQGQVGTTFVATGDITWQVAAGMVYPCDLTIDATATFDSQPPGNLTISETFSAQSIPVVGCI